MSAELAAIDDALERDIPYFGTCLGMQALAKVAGGDVVKDKAVEEIGFADGDNRYYEVELTEEGSKDPLFDGLPEAFQTFHLHGEAVAANGDVTQLATGKICPVQAIRVGDMAYGMQAHMELTREMLMLWGLEDPQLQYIGQGTLLVQYNRVDHEYTRNGKRMFENFLRVALSTALIDI
jgi:GMP synthase-like glutamine amidotransferase